MPNRNHQKGHKHPKHTKRPGKNPLVPGKDIPLFAFVILGFFLVNLIGFALLMLPVSSTDGKFTDPINAFFTATSATTDTGLATVNTSVFLFYPTLVFVFFHLTSLRPRSPLRAS